MTTIEIIALSVLGTLFVAGLVTAMLLVRSKVNRLEDETVKHGDIDELYRKIADLENHISNQLDRAPTRMIWSLARKLQYLGYLLGAK